MHARTGRPLYKYIYAYHITYIHVNIMHTGPTHARDTDLHLLLLGGSSEKMLPVKFYSYTGMIHIEVDATDLHLQLLEGSSNELLSLATH